MRKHSNVVAGPWGLAAWQSVIEISARLLDLAARGEVRRVRVELVRRDGRRERYQAEPDASQSSAADR